MIVVATDIDSRVRPDPEQWVRGEYPERSLSRRNVTRRPHLLELEYEKLWPHVWQMACRQEEIPNVGDYIEYSIGDQSILVVRSAPGTIKAFHNVCMHRGRALMTGCGNVREFRCVFTRGGTTSTDRSKRLSTPIPSTRLRSCRTTLPSRGFGGHLGGFVFINFDREAEPLGEFLGENPSYIRRRFARRDEGNLHSHLRSWTPTGRWRLKPLLRPITSRGLISRCSRILTIPISSRAGRLPVCTARRDRAAPDRVRGVFILRGSVPGLPSIPVNRSTCRCMTSKRVGPCSHPRTWPSPTPSGTRTCHRVPIHTRSSAPGLSRTSRPKV